MERSGIMALTLKEITLWRRHMDNTPGALAQVLEPFSGSDLNVVMAYRIPGKETQAVVELYPITGKRATSKAQASGLVPADIPALWVQGPNRAGIGFQTTSAFAEAGINLAFLVTQVIGTRFSSIYGFDSDADRRQAIQILKQKPKRKR
jgi:hypothetical protein